MLNIRVEQKNQPRCPYCKDADLGGDLVGCQGCGTISHAACFAEHGRCASCGRDRSTASSVSHHDLERFQLGVQRRETMITPHAVLAQIGASMPAPAVTPFDDTWADHSRAIRMLRNARRFLNVTLSGMVMGCIVSVIMAALGILQARLKIETVMLLLGMIALRMLTEAAYRFAYRAQELHHYKIESLRLETAAKLRAMLGTQDRREEWALPLEIADPRQHGVVVQTLKFDPKSGCILTLCAVCRQQLLLRVSRRHVREVIARCSKCPSWVHSACVQSRQGSNGLNCPDKGCSGHLEYFDQGIDPRHDPCERCSDAGRRQ